MKYNNLAYHKELLKSHCIIYYRNFKLFKLCKSSVNFLYFPRLLFFFNTVLFPNMFCSYEARLLCRSSWSGLLKEMPPTACKQNFMIFASVLKGVEPCSLAGVLPVFSVELMNIIKARSCLWPSVLNSLLCSCVLPWILGYIHHLNSEVYPNPTM